MFKKRAKFVAIAALCLLLALCLVAFAACNGDSKLQDRIRDLEAQVSGYEADVSEKTVTVYIGEGENNCRVITTRKAFLHDLLKDMKRDGAISEYAYSGDGISAFLTSIDGLQQDYAAGKYYSVWHNLDNYTLKSIYDPNFHPGRGVDRVEGEGAYASHFTATTYNDTLLYYSNVGVGLLPLVDGAVYAIFVD